MINKTFLSLVQTLRAIFFEHNPNQGHTPAELRCAIEQYAANLSVSLPTANNLPDNIAEYVQNVTRHAYKLTDEDIVTLKQAGYSEDEIFEITISAALGAGRTRLEAGLDALYGEPVYTDTIDTLRQLINLESVDRNR